MRSASPRIPTSPRAFFDALPGDDRTLIRWEAMLSYFRTLATESPRLRVETIGQSTEQRDMILVTIAHPDVIQELDSHTSRRQLLLDNHLLADPHLKDGTAAGDKVVVLITSAIHATEVGSVQLCPELVHDLVTRDDGEIEQMLDHVILLIVPSLNPDGMDLVHDWYEQTLGTHAEGSNPPTLYHRYAGHDNNRDWVHLKLAESRVLVERVHRPWKPHMVLDLHQMQTTGPRFFLPPFIDPIEQHVHPILVSGGNALGSHIATRMIANGFAGTTTGVLFDAFSPTRAYAHYHGGVRILAEAASARLATPITIDHDAFVPSRGVDPRIPGVGNPLPWSGGTWRLRDIMNYHRESVLGTIDHAASHHLDWIKRQWHVLAESANAPEIRTFVIPPLEHQTDPAAARTLLSMMSDAEIHIERLTTGAHDELGHAIVRGSYLVSTSQPFGTWPQALLPPTIYPDPSPGSRPYDTTSHSLAVHMGVEITESAATGSWDTTKFDPAASGSVSSLNTRRSGQGRWVAVDPRGHNAIRLVAESLRDGRRVRRLSRAHFAEGRVHDPGSWIISGVDSDRIHLRADELGIRSFSVLPIPDGMLEQRQPRIGIHIANRGNATDAGWTRLVLEEHAIPYIPLDDDDLVNADLSDLDVILLPHISATSFVNGNPAEGYPDILAGKPGVTGFQRLLEFIQDGGRVVAIDGSAQACIEQFRLPIDLPLLTLDDNAFYAPGGMIRIVAAPGHPTGWGLPAILPAMLNGKIAFRPKRGALTYDASFHAPPDGLVVSGWMRGPEHLAGLDLVADIRIDTGMLTLIGIRPQFRAQTHVSFNLLFNALYNPGLHA